MKSFCSRKSISCADAYRQVVPLETAVRDVRVELVVVVGQLSPDVVGDGVGQAGTKQKKGFLLAVQFLATATDLSILKAASQGAMNPTADLVEQLGINRSDFLISSCLLYTSPSPRD